MEVFLHPDDADGDEKSLYFRDWNHCRCFQFTDFSYWVLYVTFDVIRQDSAFGFFFVAALTDVLRPTARRAQEVAAEYRGGSARGREGPAGVMPSLQQMAAGKARMRNTPQVRSSVPPDAPPFPKGISEFPSRGQIVLPGRGVSSRVADARPGPTPARPVADSPPTSNLRFRIRSAHTPLPSLSRPDRGDPHDGGPARGEG